jgi:hypothetical protein
MLFQYILVIVIVIVEDAVTKKFNNISNPIFIPSALSGHIEEIKYVLFNNLQWEKILNLKVLQMKFNRKEI